MSDSSEERAMMYNAPNIQEFEKLEKRVDNLEKRVAELEKTISTPSIDAPGPSHIEQPITVLDSDSESDEPPPAKRPWVIQMPDPGEPDVDVITDDADEDYIMVTYDSRVPEVGTRWTTTVKNTKKTTKVQMPRCSITIRKLDDPGFKPQLHPGEERIGKQIQQWQAYRKAALEKEKEKK